MKTCSVVSLGTSDGTPKAASTAFDTPLGWKRCWLCKERQPVTAFRIDRKRRSGRGATCKACVSANRKANKELRQQLLA